ncbi:MAG: septation protein A [Legionellales bacterium]|jgi:intracellular septation protein
MKLLFEIITLILFFAAYQIYNLNAAILVVIIAYTGITVFNYFKHKRLSKSQIATFVLVVVLGGATLVLDNELFFKWKPTVVCWLFASVLLGSYVFTKQNLLQRLGSDNLKLPNQVWKRLNFAWIIFFAFMGGINLFVAYNFDTTTWVYFKLFGAVGLLLSFLLIQAICLWPYINEQNTKAS